MPDLLRSFLQKLIKRGSLEVFFGGDRSFTVGDGDEPSCAIKIRDRGAELALALDPEMVLGELYTDGRIEMVRGEIFDLLALGASNFGAMAVRRIKGWQKLRWAVAQARRGVHPGRARANAAHHYDLDAKLYPIFLDRDMQYSCAYFESPSFGLDEAQTAKKRHIAAKLAVDPGHRVLDIGCGWGGLALYLARFCGADVSGVTLATEQVDVARKRAERAGLAEQVRFDLLDYRHIRGRFDRIVSVGMFEHVGPKHYDAFFARIAEMLEEDGVALIHTIGHFAGPAPTNPWVIKYIFPDGHIPALAEIAPAIARAGLMVADVETLREHYALTLEHWRARFKAGREQARKIYGERFCRMWEFYLAAAECGFRFHGCCVLQIQLIKRLDALPITRDYIKEREAALRAREIAAQNLSDAAE